MQVESLETVRAAFEEWRRRRRYVREAIPASLIERARQAARRYGPAQVARATKVCRSRLAVGGSAHRSGWRAGAASPPAYSRVELAAPTAARAFVELETATGLKVRFFSESAETLALISTLCGSGGET